jgi:hypothetical protein
MPLDTSSLLLLTAPKGLGVTLFTNIRLVERSTHRGLSLILLVGDKQRSLKANSHSYRIQLFK